MKSMISNAYKDIRGVAAVEFAIVAPVFIFLLLGMTAYGIYFSAVHSVQQLAADTARAAIAGLDATERNQLAQDYVTVNASHYVLLDPAALSVVVTDSAADPNQFEVAVSYDAQSLPIWSLHSPLPLPSKTIARQSTIRIGGL